MSNLEITDVKIYPFDRGEPDSRTVAYADITFSGELIVKGFRVIAGKGGGLFVGFPSRKNREGVWRETVLALDDKLKKYIRDRVVEAYKQAY